VTCLEAVLFDMDGTLIHSEYDWPTIRLELGVDGPSIIDALNALREPQRAESWARLEAVERQASDNAVLVDGTENLLSLLAERGIKTALVTNNSTENTEALMARFDLSFDVVITRDSGLFKPSGAPLVEAMRRLGVSGAETIAVGDSHYDVQAAREAGCAMVIIVNGGCRRWGKDADQAFEDLRELAEFLDKQSLQLR
jgi:HAD superfamily hydrolase (TIGR01509 family)